MGNVLDLTKLDPIQAAMYVSQMYEKEARSKSAAKYVSNKEHVDKHDTKKIADKAHADGLDDGGEEGGEPGKEDENLSDGLPPIRDGKQIFPKHLYEKMKK